MGGEERSTYLLLPNVRDPNPTNDDERAAGIFVLSVPGIWNPPLLPTTDVAVNEVADNDKDAELVRWSVLEVGRTWRFLLVLSVDETWSCGRWVWL